MNTESMPAPKAPRAVAAAARRPFVRPAVQDLGTLSLVTLTPSGGGSI